MFTPIRCQRDAAMLRYAMLLADAYYAHAMMVAAARYCRQARHSMLHDAAAAS